MTTLFLLAQAVPPVPSQGDVSWQTVGALSAVLGLFLALAGVVRMIMGKGSERQVEPTQLAALQLLVEKNHTELTTTLKAITDTQSNLNREIGGIVAKVDGTQRELEAHKRDTKEEVGTALTTLNREMGGVMAKVEGNQRELTEHKATTRENTEGVHVRLGGISRELAATTAKVSGLEDRENRKRS